MSLSCAGPWLPALLALGSAVLFAFGIQFARLGLRDIDSQTGTLITIGAAAALYWVSAPLFVEAHFWTSPALLLFAAIGLFRPVLSGNLAMAGTKRLGPTISSTMTSTALLFGLGFGVLALGEALTPRILVGTLAIMTGVVALSWRRGGTHQDWALWALLLPVGAAFLRVFAQLLAKVGMETLPSPFFVGLAGYTVSFVVALVGAGLRRRPAPVPVRSRAWGWFAGAGTVNGLSILSLNQALQCGDLVVVSPIVASSPLFTLILGLLVFGERGITRRVVFAVLLVVPGVMLVASR